ncbi:MAG TPA: cobalt ECF transporter T component CbiQ [Anaerolineae bacterium]|nr:cobalt ECF transporter T component CbiQ [Anaerolineae bacterium]
MHVHFTDQYRSGSSLIHRLDPRIKVLSTLAFILTASLLPTGLWLHYALLLCAPLFVSGVAGLGPGYILKRSFIALPFALAAITLPFTVPGAPLATLPLFGGLTLSVEGTVRFLSIVLKSWISVQMAILLVATTPFPDLLWGLRALHIPRVLVSIVALMYRYIFVLADEAMRLARARAARSGMAAEGKAGGSIAWRGKVTGGMVGNLALRSFERSERIYDAMVARGYTGEIRHFAPPRLSPNDHTTAAVLFTFLALLLVTGFLFGG